MMEEMIPTRSFPLLLLILSPLATLAGSTIHSRFIGTYLSPTRDDTRPGPSMELSLGPDGTATVTEDPGSGITTLFGHWVDTGAQVKVTFDAAEPPMVFAPSHSGLQAITWNHETWGKTNPPPMKQGGKVKERLTHAKSGE
jgi:hypothetical protein